MSKKVRVRTAIPNNGAFIKNNFEVEITDELVSEEIIMEYISPSDGGPLMRPKNPPA